MGGKQAWRFAAVALFAAGVVAATAPLGSGKSGADASPISPFVKCVEKQANHTYDALFGYDNTGTAATIAPGADNHFSMPAPNGKQPPSHFASGHVTNAVFISNIPNGTDFTWSVTVDGVEHLATASSTAARCKSSGGGGGGTTT